VTESIPTPARASRRPPRERSATESLLTVTLGMELLVVVFGTIAINGLGVLPAGVAVAGGAGLFVLLLITIRVVRYPWGIWLGHAVQVLLLLTGFVEVLAAVTAAIFVGFWIYSFVRGRQLDAAKLSHHPDLEAS
jgi:hypothetical protein